MKDWNRRTLILMLAILVVVPLLVERYFVGRGVWFSKSELRQKERRDWLRGLYECTPPLNCYKVDFNKDGMHEFVNVRKPPEIERESLIVTGGGGSALLKLPFNSRRGEHRTRTAIVYEGVETHLLVYDPASYSHPLKSVFRYDGYAMSGASPTPLESEILTAMAMASEDARRQQMTAAGSSRSFLKLFCYYFALAVLVTVIGYRRRDGETSGGNANFSLRGHP